MNRNYKFRCNHLARILVTSGILCITLSLCQKAGLEYYEMTTIATRDIYFEKAGKRISFTESTIREIQRAFGTPSLEHRITANESGEVKIAYYDGFSVEYYNQSGKLTFITIKSKEISILGEICVGDTIEKVNQKLRNGIVTANGMKYIFVVMQADSKSGIGYIIEYDTSASVKEIRIGGVPFGI